MKTEPHFHQQPGGIGLIPIINQFSSFLNIVVIDPTRL